MYVYFTCLYTKNKTKKPIVSWISWCQWRFYVYCKPFTVCMYILYVCGGGSRAHAQYLIHAIWHTYNTHAQYAREPHNMTHYTIYNMTHAQYDTRTIWHTCNMTHNMTHIQYTKNIKKSLLSLAFHVSVTIFLAIVNDTWEKEREAK